MTNISLHLASACLGIILFFTIILAPTVFKVLSKESASIYLRAFFPKFYIFLFLISGLAALLSQEKVTTFFLTTIALLFLISRWPLTTAINNATDKNNKKLFNILHSCSVVIILIQIIMFLTLFFVN